MKLSLIALLSTVIAVGCAREITGGAPPMLPDSGDGREGMDAGMDGGRFGNGPNGSQLDASFDDYDASINPDAFFVSDPLPPYCGPDPDHVVETPTGSLACPSDKNREGCPCTEAGQEAACWPGKRLNREHGICEDGMTRCVDTEEFGLRWGPARARCWPSKARPRARDCRCFFRPVEPEQLVACIYRCTMHRATRYKTTADGTQLR